MCALYLPTLEVYFHLHATMHSITACLYPEHNILFKYEESPMYQGEIGTKEICSISILNCHKYQ